MSDFTNEQKEKIKKRDNYQCQFDVMFGVIELTKISCSKKLHIHHKIYRKNKQFLKDGIVICERCHEWFVTCFARYIRYEDRAKDTDLNNKFGFNQIKLGDKSV